MDLGYRSRSDAPPIQKHGVVLKDRENSWQVKLEGVVTPAWLPKSQCEFHQDGEEGGKPAGTFEIPAWLARKEGLN